MLRSLKFVSVLAAVAILAMALPAAAAPVLTSISPTSGYPGTQVTLTGTNFGATQGTGSIWLGSKAAGSIVSWSNTQVVAVVAANAASGSAQVQQGGTWSNAIAFTIITPSLTSISPTSGYPGTQVTLTGTNFGATQGSGSVWLGNKLAGSIVSWSGTQIVATVASTAASGSAQVQQGGVWGNAITFTVITPNITGITPTSGVAGTQVTITGTNFGATQGSGSVWLGSKLAGSIVSWSNTQIVATVDAGSVTGSAQVQQGGVWSNSIAFTVATPTLTSVSPTTARAGDQITLTGTNFGATQGSGSVWLGSKLAGSIVSWSNTQVVATVASGSITGNAQVQQNTVWTNAIALTVLTPTLTSISPTTARAGDQVTLTGTNFGSTQGSGSVWLGSKLAGSIVSWSDTQIVATVASGAIAGVAQVQQGGVWSNTIAFSVTVPVIESMWPNLGFGGPGQVVPIDGEGFGATQGSGQVWLGSQYATVVSWSDTHIDATVAAGSVNGVAQVFQGGVWSNTSHFAVTCASPGAVSADPADQVWVEDTFPDNSSSEGLFDSMQAATGTQSFYAQGAEGAIGYHIAYLGQDHPPHKLNPGDSIVFYMLIDPCNVPQQLLLTLNSNYGWNRLSWGSADPLGAAGDAIQMGAMPAAGQWQRIEIPAQDVGIVGANLYTLILEHFDGVIWFDHLGKKPTSPAPADITSFTTTSQPPFHIGDQLTFTTTATGNGTIEYRYRQVEPETYQSTTLQDWSTSNTFVWTVPFDPEYHLEIWVDVRNAGSTQEYEDLDYYDVRIECVSATAAPASMVSSDQIGIDDGVAGYVTMDNATITTSQQTLGTSSFTTTTPANYLTPLVFSGLQNELPADPNESLVFYALIDDCGAGQQGRIQLYVETAPDAAHPTPVGRTVDWETDYHDATWIADMPQNGVWTRMEVPQSVLNFGFTPTAYGKISFLSWGPRVWYDAIGTTHH